MTVSFSSSSAGKENILEFLIENYKYYFILICLPTNYDEDKNKFNASLIEETISEYLTKKRP